MLEQFTYRSHDKLRYGDTDRNGHVNNAVFSTFLETGRVEMLAQLPVKLDGTSFVIARLELDYLAQVTWPGTVEIGTSIVKIGRSSVTLAQAVFQHGRLCAQGQTVIVHVDPNTGRSVPLPEEVRHV